MNTATATTAAPGCFGTGLSARMENATCSQPTDPTPALLAAKVVRVAKSGTFPWEVHCEIDPHYCSTRAKTKREAAEWATAPSWVRFAAMAAERQDLTRIAPPPPSACAKDHREPFHPTLEAPWHISGWGDSMWCGRPIIFLKGARTLAEHRLAWAPERLAETLRFCDRWASDWHTWVAASEQAKTDLLAGRLTPEEEAALGATPETAPWLRLVDYERGRLSSGAPPVEGEDLRKVYTPGYSAHDSYCWAPNFWTAG